MLDGYNAGMFAYGQSGGGKTYSMMGKEGELTGILHSDTLQPATQSLNATGDLRGIVPRAMSDLFYAANRMTEESRGGMEVVISLGQLI